MISLSDSYWIAIDTETTGVSRSDGAKIVELGVCLYHPDSGAITTISQLINPGCPIPADASAVNNIYDRDVALAPPIGDAWHPIRATIQAGVGLGDAVIVAYNFPFDDKFLEAELGPWWTSYRNSHAVIDPLTVVRFDKVGRYWRGKGRHKLGAVLERLGFPPMATHRAADDAFAACLVLQHLLRHLPDNAEEAALLIEVERQRQDENFRAWQASQDAMAPRPNPLKESLDKALDDALGGGPWEDPES